MDGIHKPFNRKNTQEEMAEHTFIAAYIEPMQCTQSHRSKQKAGVEEAGYVSLVAFGKEQRNMA